MRCWSRPIASIFLSYSHEDAKRAQRLARQLDSAGHSVWYDRNIHAGSRFSKDIDEALKASELVVVLWSKASIESPWVQDEAAFGRDRGRLVPVLIDDVDPPLGFRQYQAIKMPGGKAAPVVRAVAALLATDSRQPASPLRSQTPSRRRPLALLVLALIAALASGFWFFRDKGSGTSSLSIVAAKASNSPIADMVAEELATAMRSFTAGPVSALEIMPAERGGGTYEAALGVAEDERQVSIDLALSHERDGRIWSFEARGPPHTQADRLLEIAGRLGNVLACDLDIRKRNYEVTSEVRALYLQGCSRMGDLSQQRDEQAINAFRQAALKAPKFAPAWAHLALAYYAAIGSAPPGEERKVAWTAGRYNMMARRLDPTLPEPYYVAAFNGPTYPGKMAEALGTIDEGLRNNPDSALLFDARSTVLANLGLLQQALESSKRALSIEPLSPAYLGSYVLMLVYTGQIEAAQRKLEETAKKWPRSAAIAEIQYSLNLRYGNARDALNVLRRGELGPVNSDEGMRLYLQARIDPTLANVEAVLRYYRLQFEMDPEDTFHYVQALGTFGRFDEVYAVLLSDPQAIHDFTRNGEGLFRPYMRKMLDDPRFMTVAYRAGMLTFWRKTGQWPDFCSDPQLPYDCKREAAKFPLEAPKPSA